ncbi:hypothetical protein DIE19_31485 [Burkholderia sp. Bp9126]|nr:hypothetical protein DIE19_31485 [Burkholderia sp. Bp9126]
MGSRLLIRYAPMVGAALMLVCGIARAEYREQWISATQLQRETQQQASPRTRPGSIGHASDRKAGTTTVASTHTRRRIETADRDPIAAFAETGSKNGVKRSLKTVGRRVPS